MQLSGENSLLSMAVGNHAYIGPGVVEFMITNGLDVSISGIYAFEEAINLYQTNIVELLLPLYARADNPDMVISFRRLMVDTMERSATGMSKIIVERLLQCQTNQLPRAVLADDFSTIDSILATNSQAAEAADALGWAPLHVAAAAGDVGRLKC